MKKVSFHNLGCKVNSYEIEYIQQMFKQNGYEIVPFDQKSDIYIINTCSVTNIADRKSRQMIHKAKSMNENAIVVALGCYVQTNFEKAKMDEAIDIAIGNEDKGKTFEIVTEFLNEREEAYFVTDISKSKAYDNYILEETAEHTRVYVKIQDGCNQFCSYCLIPYARGRVRSRQLGDIIKEITGLTEKGYKEFVLTGIHLSSYMSDDGKTLIDVIEEVGKINEVKRIRLGSLEPRIITDEFLERLSKVEAICPHFHLSLQSGSDTVLKRMNRKYSANEFYEKTLLIRKYFEHPALTTDVIVGFPGETDEEFQETREFLQKVNFFEVHVFKFSRRAGTVADKMPMQLTDKEKTVRSEILIADSKIREEEYKRYYIGKDVEVLFEEEKVINDKKVMAGHTREYMMVYSDDLSYKSGDIGKVNYN